MPNCDFYALGNDGTQVLDFVFSQPGWVLHELASELDRPVRVFRSTDDLEGACPLGSTSRYFQLYAPEMKGHVVHEKITLDPGVAPGFTHRFSSNGWGLVQLYFGHLEPGGGLTPSHTNHNSEKRALAWADGPSVQRLGHPSRWDWTAVTRISSRLNRFLRARAASTRGSRPVLPAAAAAAAGGTVQLLLNG